MERPSDYQAQQGLTVYFLGKLHSGLKKLSAYYRQRGITVFNITDPAELARAFELRPPHALVIDLQSCSEITSFFEALGQHDGLLELPRVAIISSNADEETAETLKAQADDYVVWPLKATDLSLRLFDLLLARDHFVRLKKDPKDDEGSVYRGLIAPGYLRDLLQLVYLGRRDCILSLECEGRRGNLYFKDGRLIDAQVGALEWQDSLKHIQRFKTGSFVLSFQSVDRKKFIDRNVTSWLLQEPDEPEPPYTPEPADATEFGPISKATEAPAPPASASTSEDTDTGMPPTPDADQATGKSAVHSSPDPLMPPPPPMSQPREARNAPTAGAGLPAGAAPAGLPAGATLSSRPSRLGPPRSADADSTRPAIPDETQKRSLWPVVFFLLVVVVGAGFVINRFLTPPPPVKVVTTRVTIPTPVPMAPTLPPAPTPPPPPLVTPQPVVPTAEPAETTTQKVTEPPKDVPITRIEKVAGKYRTHEVPPESTPKPAKIAVVTTKPVAPTPRPAPLPTPKPELPAATPKPAPVKVATANVGTPDTGEPEFTTNMLPERNLRKARELEKAGKLQEALAVYMQVADLDPSSREASDAISRLKDAAVVNPNAPGELHINAFPYGIAYVDGEKQGYTPVHLNKVVPRKYLIRVVNPDLGAWCTEVVVKPGEPKWVHLRLDGEQNCQR